MAWASAGIFFLLLEKESPVEPDDAFSNPSQRVAENRYNGTILWNSLGPNAPVLREGMVQEPSRYIMMLIESKSECSDMGIWGFDANGATSKTFGFYVHPNKRMQALYLDTHAKSTKFSQTLGTSQDDQQWSFLTKCLLQDCKKIIDTARNQLKNPTVQAVYN